MAAFEPGWEVPRTVQRLVVLPDTLETLVVRQAKADGTTPSALIAEIWTEYSRNGNGNGHRETSPNSAEGLRIERMIVLPTEADAELENRARELQADPSELVVSAVAEKISGDTPVSA